MKKIAIINGVNLQQLGTREVDIYGARSFDEYFTELKRRFPQFELHAFQSDDLAEIVRFIHRGAEFDGIVLNAGAYTHTAIVLADAIKSISTPVVEVHISNIFNRENYRKNSFIAAACVGSISGFGLKSYDLALFSFDELNLHSKL